MAREARDFVIHGPCFRNRAADVRNAGSAANGGSAIVPQPWLPPSLAWMRQRGRHSPPSCIPQQRRGNIGDDDADATLANMSLRQVSQ